jgi:DNA (cytosine-5)-methyltransferase 1
MILTFGSLFAGIGGFDLGLERAGMVCQWQVEIDPFCQKVLAKHWPNVRRHADVREVGKHNLKPVDVICGGFPCQPHSLAGKRKGAADDRDLWPEYRRVIAELNPAWVIGENVPGIRTTILDSVLSDLENLNYAWQAFIIPACAVDARHRRDRIFIVAYSASKQKHAERDRPGGFSEQSGRTVEDGREAARPAHREAGHNGFSGRGSVVPHANGEGLEGANGTGATRAGGWSLQCVKRYGWQPEPGMGRVANGVPDRVDRLRSLGNAVVPQLAEFIGRLVVNNSVLFAPKQ